MLRKYEERQFSISFSFFFFRRANEAVSLRSVIGKYTCSIYALESMLYLTTGIMDKYDNTNIDLETAIFKVKTLFITFLMLFR